MSPSDALSAHDEPVPISISAQFYIDQNETVGAWGSSCSCGFCPCAYKSTGQTEGSRSSVQPMAADPPRQCLAQQPSRLLSPPGESCCLPCHSRLPDTLSLCLPTPPDGDPTQPAPVGCVVWSVHHRRRHSLEPLLKAEMHFYTDPTHLIFLISFLFVVSFRKTPFSGGLVLVG